MLGRIQLITVLFVSILLHGVLAHAATPSFICKEPGGKRLVRIMNKEISKADDDLKTLLWVDGNDILTDPHAEATLVVTDDDIRHSPAGVKLATWDGENIRHGKGGKIIINYHHPDICPDPQSNRIYSIEGEAISKQQLVAGLYLIDPDLFKLTDAETAEQQNAIKEAAAEQEKLDAADQVAGKWMVLNNSGIAENLGKGMITVDAKKGAAYSAAFDFTKGGGPSWTGEGVYRTDHGDKLFYVAYGSPKSIGLCVYEISGGNLKGTWYPWYQDGTEKNLGTENLSGAEGLNGDYKIDSAKAPATGAAYSGTVSIKPLEIVGASDDAKPYSITWNFGTAVVKGIGIRSGNLLFVASGTGADTSIAKFKIENGSMTSDWYKLGSKEKGGSAATSMN